jgi:hypothetical protein
MTDDRPDHSGYHVSSRLLARKGGAEPLSDRGTPLIIAGDKHRIQMDDEHLADAVIDATLDILIERPQGGRARQGAAPLTVLLDPALIEAARRKKKFFET